jgi:hypothetical protein
MLSSSDHADLEVRILTRVQDAAGKSVYRVELTLDQAQEFSGTADLDGLQPWAPGGVESKEQYGAGLFTRLFTPGGELKSAWDRARGQCPLRRIRLRIDPQLPELHLLQWELLRDPDGAPGADMSARSDTPFSRYLAQEWQPGRAIIGRPIRVLVAIANPVDLQQRFGLQAVDVQAEFKSLLAATAGLTDEDGKAAIQFDLLPEPCTLDAIRDQLKQGYHILHFIGHGVFAQGQNPAGVAVDEAALLLTDPANGNKTRPVVDRDIATMLTNFLAGTTLEDESRLRLVFLESCETAKRSANDAFRGLAPMLVKAGVAAVIAMQDLIEVKTARPFAAAFYRQLLRHGLVDLACNEARDAAKAQKLRGADVPVLFMRLRSGELLRVKGQLGTGGDAAFWTRLIANINEDLCVPFLGPRMNRGILPRPETIATELAAQNGYRLADAHNLARVAQFESFKDPGAFRRTYLNVLKTSLYKTLGTRAAAVDAKALAKMKLTALAETVGWKAAASQVEAFRIYDLLAALEMPLYVTTNADPFMFHALRERPGQNPQDVRWFGPRWQKMTAGAPSYTLAPKPTNATPYVLHLNGIDHPDDVSQLEYLALSEDEFMASFVRLVRDQVEILPSDVQTRLAASNWVFLGYSLDDWEFRLVLQGLLQPLAQAGVKKKLHVGVQLESATAGAGRDADAAVHQYLQQYLDSRFNITVYWGTPSQFVAELYERFTKG